MDDKSAGFLKEGKGHTDRSLPFWVVLFGDVMSALILEIRYGDVSLWERKIRYVGLTFAGNGEQD